MNPILAKRKHIGQVTRQIRSESSIPKENLRQYPPLDWLQAGRGLAALIVLLFHVNITLALPKYLGINLFPLLDFADCGIHFFFVLSGFVIFLAHEKEIGLPGRVGPFLWKRFRRVYPPLWVVLLLLLPVFALLPEFGVAQFHAWSELPAAFAISPAEREWLLAVEWTLRHEVLFYVAFALMLWRPGIGGCLLAGWVLLSGVLPWFDVAYPWMFYFSSLHLLFAFGALAAAIFRRECVPCPGWLLMAGVIVFVGGWAMLAVGLTTRGDGANLTFGLGATLMILGGAALERQGRLRVPSWLIFLGNASYAIYLVHFPLISLLTKLAMMLTVTVPSGLLFLLIATPALFGGVLFHLAVEKPLLRWLR